MSAAIVTEHVEKALLAFTVEDVREWDLRVALMAFGGRLMTTYMSPTLLNVYRIAITENVRFPGAGSEIL